MTNWRARTRLLAFACVAGLAFSGCGADGGSGGENDGGGADQADGSGGGDGEGGDEELSPLEEYMGANSGFARAGGARMTMALSAGDLSDEEQQKMRQVEELVAQCMQDAGFEYVPVDPFAGAPEDDPFAEAYSLPPDEFAREYGYGMSTLMRREAPEDEQNLDPNQEIREGLSEAALEEYNRTLWGDMADVSPDGGAVSIKPAQPGEAPSMEEQGCHGQARAEVYGDGGGMMVGPDMSEFESLFEDLEALRERIESDPRVVAATEEWAVCMAEAGSGDFEGLNEPEDAVMERMGELYGWETEQGGPEGGPGVSVTTEGGGWVESDVSPEDLEELQQWEVAVATADYDCEQEHFEDAQSEVALGFEEEFVDQHRAELERYRDTMAEGPAGHAGGLG
ncbi:hypothetical protein [Jiangella mangrovi]|uniref:DUF305 domain-containing protein n=1 Tax=Jiangella mangrovi TaxID=1524084 RepID=A0A7W9GN96_9ACTN|nr:hypothetical protein [Jiangella mangrovi]MBB5786832.1 hypothetical protein [Jiangella mangrovi]